MERLVGCKSCLIAARTERDSILHCPTCGKAMEKVEIALEPVLTEADLQKM